MEVGEGSTHSLLVGLQTAPATIKISVKIPVKARNRFTM